MDISLQSRRRKDFSWSCSDPYRVFVSSTSETGIQPCGGIPVSRKHHFCFLFPVLSAFVSDVYEHRDVCYYAKVRILKQITTRLDFIHLFIGMFVIMQR